MGEIHFWTGVPEDFMKPQQAKFVLCLSGRQKPSLRDILSGDMTFTIKSEEVTCRECLWKLPIPLVTSVGNLCRVVVGIQEEDLEHVYLTMDYGQDSNPRTFKLSNEQADQISRHLYDRASRR